MNDIILRPTDLAPGFYEDDIVLRDTYMTSQQIDYGDANALTIKQLDVESVPLVSMRELCADCQAGRVCVMGCG